MNRPLGEGDFDPFFPEAFQNPVAKLVLDEIRVHEFADLADEGKIEGRILEARDEPQGNRQRISEYPGHGPFRFPAAASEMQKKKMDGISRSPI
jgi:hypothetical protein